MFGGFNRPGDGAGGLKPIEKKNFVANLIARGQSALISDSVATLVSKVLNLASVGAKKTATATVFSDASGNIVISGLAFQPSFIEIHWYLSAGYFRLVYDVSNDPMVSSGSHLSDYLPAEYAGTQVNNRLAAGTFVISGNGFTCNGQGYMPSGTSVTYRAYE